MGTRPIRFCDTLGTTKDVRRYSIEILDIEEADSQPVLKEEIDLSPRGLLRLTKFVGHGTSSPSGNTSPTEAGA